MKIVFKIICFILGCGFIFIIAVSSNSKWFGDFCTLLPPFKYGDLYLYSNMPGFRIPCTRVDFPKQNKLSNNVSLTIIGDSYIKPLDSNSFHAGEYRFIHWDNIPDTIPALNSEKRNVLIIETTERYCRWRLMKANPILIGKKKEKIEDNNVEIKLTSEDNLQQMIVNQDFVLPFKEIKTYIYLNCFNRFDNRVAIPNGTGRLFAEETTNPEKTSSCYSIISDDEINNIVNNINVMFDNELKLGFDEVYLSIIPNAASIYGYSSDLKYNNLIERIQNNPNLKVRFIDSFWLLKKQKRSVFFCNDTHWNSLGQGLWLEKVNGILMQK